MFSADSRYAGLELAELTQELPSGEQRTLRYVRRRFLPALGTPLELARHNVDASDRLDNISARYLGDPLQFWRICDAHAVLRPSELTAQAGATILIPLVIR